MSWRTLPVMAAPSYTPRRDAGLAAYENVLARAGLAPVAGIDEAGRGACAGPLVVAAVVLDKAAIKRIDGLADSKLLTPAAREEAYGNIVRHALDWHVTTIPHTEIDAIGLHVCNVEGMRRACAGTDQAPGVRADGRLPCPGTRRAGPGDVEGRPRGRVGGGRVDRGQGDQGPDDAGAR